MLNERLDGAMESDAWKTDIKDKQFMLFVWNNKDLNAILYALYNTNTNTNKELTN